MSNMMFPKIEGLKFDKLFKMKEEFNISTSL
jgi:hypothetical protein